MQESENQIIATPHVSYDAARKVVEALYAFKKPGSAKDIVNLVDLNQTNTSKALSVARTLGFVKQTKRAIYELTKSGRDLARLLGFGKDDEASLLVKKALLSREEWAEVIAFLRTCMKKPGNPLDLVLHVELRMNRQWTPSMRNSLATIYRSILIGGGLINPDEAQIVPLLDIEEFDDIELNESDPLDETPISGDDKITPTLPQRNEYITFSLPDLYSFNVRATIRALDNLRKQILDETPIAIWIDASIEALNKDK